MMMEYQFEDKEPETVPHALRIAWPFIRKDLEDARRHYETRVQNGKKGGRKKNREEPGEPETNREEVMSTSTSSSTTTTTSTTASPSINTGSAPAVAAGVGEEKYSFGEFGWVKLTGKQYQQLEALMGREELSRCITYMDELSQSTGNRNRWKDWYLMVRRCHDKRWHETGYQSTKPEIPKGASGILGEAELEAIKRVLRDESPAGTKNPVSL
jgi:hypothetical protein